MRILLVITLLIAAGAATAQALPRWQPLDNPAAEQVVASGASARVQAGASRTRLAVRSVDGGKTWGTLRIGSESPNVVIGHPVQEDVLFAAMAYAPAETAHPMVGFLHQSRDGGATWRGFEPRMEGARVMLGRISAGAHADLLYASRVVAGICMLGCAYQPVEALVSVDAGANWRSIDAGIARDGHIDGEYRVLYPAASQPETVYALTRSALWATRDMGRNWRRALAASRDDEVVVDRIDAELLYVRNRTRFELQASEDGGATWRAALHPDAQYGPGEGRMAADPVQRGRLYYFATDGRIFESRDAARSWRLLVLASTVGSGGNYAAGVVGVEGAARIFTAPTATARLRVEPDEYALGSGLWWNPSLGGMGISLTQHASGQVFAVWFTYAADGSPTWYVMPGGKWETPHRFDTTLFAARGTPAGIGWDPARHSTTRVGTATLVFDQGTAATLRFRFDDGREGEVALERQLFGQDLTFAAGSDHSDLWWDAGQPGWGIGIAHQRDRLFATWFTYDATGAPTWAFVSDAVLQRDANGRLLASATLHAASGGPVPGRPYTASTFSTRAIGTAGFIADAPQGTRLRMQADAFGRQQDFELTRQPF